MNQPNFPNPYNSDPDDFDLLYEPSPFRKLIRYVLRDILGTIIPAIIIAMGINLFLAQGTYVHGQSMEPNLHTAQRLVIEKVSYRFEPPKRGDVVVLEIESSDLPLIKRVVGLPGETIEIRNNQIFINSAPIEEPYLNHTVQRNYGPVQIPADHVFVMGDNRGASNDSRYFGPVATEQLIGRAWLSYWPLEDVGLIK